MTQPQRQRGYAATEHFAGALVLGVWSFLRWLEEGHTGSAEVEAETVVAFAGHR